MSHGSESENDFESADEGEGVLETFSSSVAKVVNSEVRSNIEDNKKSKETLVVESVSDSAPNEKDSKHTVETEHKTVTLPTNVACLAEDSTAQKTSTKSYTDKEIINTKPANQPDEIITQPSNELPQKLEKVLLLKERKELERASRNASTTAKDSKLPVSQTEEKNSPGWGLGGWSTSFLSTVASSASTFTSHVTQGIGTVLETVEASLGAPSPEEMAAANKKIEKVEEVAQPADQVENNEIPAGVVPEIGHAVGGLLGGVSAFTRALENTGSKVLTGGLDTLELIGKKTMDILTEGDPGLRKKRNLFGVGSDTTLSQVLRDAKDKYEKGNQVSNENLEENSSLCYSKIFDDHQGLVHLEALEILSGRCKAQLEEHLLMLGPDAKSVHSTLQELQETCLDLPPTDDTPDDEATQDFEKLVTGHMSALPISLNIDKIKTVQAETRTWVSLCKAEQDKGNVRDAKEIYEKAITSLAQLTAKSMELFHKMSELLLVTGSELADLQGFAQHFTGLTAVLCTEVGIITSQFCQCLSTAADDSEDPDAINPLITNVYLESSNSNTYIQDAFQLLIPVFQEIAVRK